MPERRTKKTRFRKQASEQSTFEHTNKYLPVVKCAQIALHFAEDTPHIFFSSEQKKSKSGRG